jgi:phenylalanyl-tRNA synthetase alpha chain
MYILTEEGKRYLKNGLPEENLVRLLKQPLSIDTASKKTENFSIAMQWAKKKGWVEIKNSKLVLVKKPGQIPEKEALKKLSEKKKVTPEEVSVLLKRKLVEEIRNDVFKKAQKLAGKSVSGLTPELIKTGLWKKVKLKPYNVEAAGEKIYPGKRQPYNRFLTLVRRKLVQLGFKEMTGPIIETEFWNFDALYQAQNHPSRDWTQTYTLKYPKKGNLPNKKIVERVKAVHENGWKTGSTGWGYKWDPEKASMLVPRAHGTCLSARTLASKPDIPGKYFAIVRCFRPDVIDATHGVEFNQVEGIVLDEGLNFRHLLGLLKMFAEEIAGAKEVRFYPDYYPFTEVSCQLSCKHPQLGWIEMGGSGIFREELTKPLGIDVPVLAWGLGIDRLAAFKLGIKDIRYLFSQDLKWLREQKVVR